MSASTLPLMSVEPPICSHVLCIFGSLFRDETRDFRNVGFSNGCNPWLDHDGPWCQELHHDHDDCD